MKFFRFCLCLILVAGTMISCRSMDDAVYVSDAERDSAMAILHSYNNTLRSGDQLSIYVSSEVPENVIDFNMETNKLAPAMAQIVKETGIVASDRNLTSGGIAHNREQNVKYNSYSVQPNGTIEFPVLGTIYVEGITLDSLDRYLERRLREEGYVTDAIVESRLLNFRVTVLGAVYYPRQYRVEGERLTIFEALALAGDITTFGRRENVVVLRENNGQQEIGVLDLTKKESLETPYYYLQPNDIVYVEPNEILKKRASRDPDLPRYIALGVNGGHLVVNVARILVQLMRMS